MIPKITSKTPGPEYYVSHDGYLLPPGHYDSDYAGDGHVPPRSEESLLQQRRRRLVTISAMVGFAVIGMAGLVGYRAFVSESGELGNPPVIRADPTPSKAVAAPATTASDEQSKRFQRTIRLITAPEGIAPREEPLSPPAGLGPATAATGSQMPNAAPPRSAGANVTSPPQPSSSEPRRVKTVRIGQEPPAPVAQPQGLAPISATGASASTGAYVVQLASARTEDDARASYQALQQKYPNVLGGRDANIRRADLGDKGVFYRAQIGPFRRPIRPMRFAAI